MGSTRKMIRWQGRTSYCLLIGLLLVFLSAWWCGTTLAAPVGAEHAHRAVGAWIAANPRPMGSQLGSQVDSVETFTNSQGQPVYYIVYLCPNGFVIVSADDLVEPIIGFVSAGNYDPSDRNPLGAMVSRDLPGRANTVHRMADAMWAVQKKTRPSRVERRLTEKETAVRKSTEKAFGKWTKLLSQADTSSALVKSASSISDVRVAPLLQTEWGQTTVCGNACFNYYTPPYGEGNADNYYSGCVATAMAQYMRFWQYPTAGVGTGCFTIYVDGDSQTGCLRGGDGSGGPYSWADMVLVPGCGTTLIQRQAIGALIYDAGVAVGMDYYEDGSAACLDDAADALVDTFGYSNAIFGFNDDDNIGAGLNGMVNPNLDYGNPVILSIASPSDGHAIVADGYGYDGSTLYHHLNLGWDGSQDAWYNMPDIDSSPSFNVVDSAIYNIYTSSTGEIISGRVTIAGSDTPISGATVTAESTDGGTYEATTNANGIYAIAKIPSNLTYTVSVIKPGYSFTSQVTNTGQSQNYQAVSGNCWAIDFMGILTSEDEVQTVDMTITKCTVKAGNTHGQDSLNASGTLEESPPDLNDITQIDVNIVSLDDDYLVYEESIDFDASGMVKGKFKYKGRLGAITSLTIDFNKKTFAMKAKNIDLTGLGCPLQLNITLGNYILSGEVDEDVVNGVTKKIPIRLMRTYKDEMRVKSAKAKSNTFTVKGEIAAEDVSVNLASEDVVITWGDQAFTIPAGNFTAQSGNSYRCSKITTTGDNGLATAKIDLDKCTFNISVKKAVLDVTSGTAGFGISFAEFNETAEINL